MPKFSPLQYVLIFARLAAAIGFLIWMGRTAVRPDPEEPLRWFDRIIRGVGVLLVGTLLVYGLPRYLGWLK